MNLLEELKSNNYAILASNGYFSYEDGIKPVINRINENIHYFEGLEVADKIIGKASAMLLTLSGVKKVYTRVLSKAGKEIFDKYGIECVFENLVPFIFNRYGTGMCPMELVVKNIDDLNEAYISLNKKVEEMKNEK